MAVAVLVPVADGSEEMEAVTIIDILRRAGASVTVAAVRQKEVTASRGVKIVADQLIKECRDVSYDLIVLPGGTRGSEHLRDSADLKAMLLRQNQNKRWLAAICAAPVVVLEHHGLLAGRRATAYPDLAGHLKNQDAIGERVVVDGHCITSQGPGTAVEFALVLVQLLLGRAKAEEVAAGLLAPGGSFVHHGEG
jgi:4-methyl-5(b-hydroxyethyl)-thiazole monophosphate biosynthesis